VRNEQERRSAEMRYAFLIQVCWQVFTMPRA
jgi:hypothetical protein